MLNRLKLTQGPPKSHPPQHKASHPLKIFTDLSLPLTGTPKCKGKAKYIGPQTTSHPTINEPDFPRPPWNPSPLKTLPPIEDISSNFKMFHHRPDTQCLGTILGTHSLSSSPYLATITLRHMAFFSLPNLQSHFTNRAQVLASKHHRPKPPSSLGLITISHSIKWSFFFSIIAFPQKIHSDAVQLIPDRRRHKWKR